MILLEKEWRDLIVADNNRRFTLDYEVYVKRDKFRSGISWHIPNQGLIDLIVENSPIVSVGSGFGYSEKLASDQGADIIATDLEPTEKNHWCSEGKYYIDVEKITAPDAVKKYSGRNVFMAWPPYDNPMAYEVVKNMEVGRKLVFVGEGYGGCTGDDNFFQYLETNFEEIDIDFTIPRWSGIYDGVRYYIKSK